MAKKKIPLYFTLISSISLLGVCLSESSKIEAKEETEPYKMTLHPKPVSNSIFDVTMPSNDIISLSKGSYNWYSTLVPSGNSIGVNFASTELSSLYLEKHPDNSYRVYLGMEAKEGDVFTFSGNFISPSIGSISISTSQFRFNGTTFEQYEPEIDIVNNDDVEVVGDTIYVNNGTSISDLKAEITNSFEGDFSFSYPEGSLLSSHFVSKEGRKEFNDLKILCLSNGYTFEYRYKLVIGYKGFASLKGAGADYSSSNMGGLEFSSAIPDKVYSGAKEIGFLSIKKDDLGTKELSVDSIFLHNDFFTFNNFDKNKININRTYPVIDKSVSPYLLKGKVDEINEKSYLDEYIGLFYLRDDYGYFLSNYYGDDISDSTRSVASSSILAINSLDEHSSELKEKYLSNIDEVSYKVRYISNENNSLLKEETYKASLNDEISINPSIVEIGGKSYRFSKNKTTKRKIIGSGIAISITLSPVGEGFNIYAYDCPTLNPKNRYDNSYNSTICNYLKQYGFTGVIYSGSIIGTNDNVDALIDIITMFYKNGLTTIVNDRSFGNNRYHFYEGVPDFSLVNGFDGFLSYDEPDTDSFGYVNSLAKDYQEKYEYSYSPFITTLLPSYGKKYNEYESYVNEYTSSIFSSLASNSLRSLCTDFYPFYEENGSIAIRDTYYNDLIYYSSLSNDFGATPYLIMQLSQVDKMNRGTYYSEMLLQSFMAISFGFRNIVWYQTFSSLETSLFVFEDGYDDENHEPKYHLTSLDYVKDVGSINLVFANIYSMLKGYLYLGSYTSSSLGNYKLSYSSKNKLSSYASSLPSDIKVNSSRPYHVGIYSNGERNAYVIGSILNNDQTNSFLTITADKDVYLNDKKSDVSKFSNLSQGESILLI